MGDTSIHVVLMPYPSAGHSAPFVHFAKHLARSGVAVSFIAPDAEIATFRRLLLGDAASNNITVVPFAFPIHQDHMDAAFFFHIRDWMQSNALTFHHILARLPGPPVCLISDMFLGFTQVPPHLSSHVSSFHLWVSKWGEWLRE
jgi:hypothetical protein